jgi:membrane associated rhomboid family serine protease
MRRGFGNYLRELDEILGVAFKPVLKWLLYLCTGVFLAQILFGPAIVNLLGASLKTTILQGQVWQLVTYAFVHGSFGHWFFNLFALWMFGSRIEGSWGSERFLRLCLAAALGAVLAQFAVSALAGHASSKIIGISGVVYAVLVAYAIRYPDEVIYFNFLIPMKVKYFVALLGVMAFLSATGAAGSGVAHLAHLGGMAVGFLFAKHPGALDFIRMPQFRGARRRGGRFRDF